MAQVPALIELTCTVPQMTAGSYCYIGPQGIVHGTTITVLNAGRKFLGSSDLAGKVGSVVLYLNENIN